MGTLAILVLLQSGARLLFTDVPIRAEPWLFGDVNVNIFGTPISANSVTILAASVLVMIAVVLWETYTTFGKAVLAAAEDPWRAALTGIHVEWTLAASWALSGVVAGLAGLLIAPITGVFPTMGFDVIFPAFIAAIIGGFSSVFGALVGGFVLGILGTYAVVYIGGAFKEVAIFVFLIAVLLWRPTGLVRTLSGRKV
jgi:branched-chain amino acid transport system permease protein